MDNGDGEWGDASTGRGTAKTAGNCQEPGWSRGPMPPHGLGGNSPADAGTSAPRELGAGSQPVSAVSPAPSAVLDAQPQQTDAASAACAELPCAPDKQLGAGGGGEPWEILLQAAPRGLPAPRRLPAQPHRLYGVRVCCGLCLWYGGVCVLCLVCVLWCVVYSVCSVCGMCGVYDVWYGVYGVVCVVCVFSVCCMWGVYDMCGVVCVVCVVRVVCVSGGEQAQEPGKGPASRPRSQTKGPPSGHVGPDLPSTQDPIRPNQLHFFPPAQSRELTTEEKERICPSSAPLTSSSSPPATKPRATGNLENWGELAFSQQAAQFWAMQQKIDGCLSRRLKTKAGETRPHDKNVN